MVSAVIRLVLAMICGAVVGYGRTKKARAAGIRTYMLVSIGAAMATLIALYEQEMINTSWSAVAGGAGAKMDVASTYCWCSICPQTSRVSAHRSSQDLVLSARERSL